LPTQPSSNDARPPPSTLSPRPSLHPPSFNNTLRRVMTSTSPLLSISRLFHLAPKPTLPSRLDSSRSPLTSYTLLLPVALLRLPSSLLLTNPPSTPSIVRISLPIPLPLPPDRPRPRPTRWRRLAMLFGRGARSVRAWELVESLETRWTGLSRRSSIGRRSEGSMRASGPSSKVCFLFYRSTARVFCSGADDWRVLSLQQSTRSPATFSLSST
jgi:hypothetical protein